MLGISNEDLEVGTVCGLVVVGIENTGKGGEEGKDANDGNDVVVDGSVEAMLKFGPQLLDGWLQYAESCNGSA